MANALADFFSSYQAGNQIADQQRGQRQQNQLAQLASQSYGAQPDQQQGILSQMAAINPQAAQAQQGQFQGDEDRRNKILANMSSLLVNSHEQSRPSLYRQILPGLQQLGIEAPPEYNAQTAGQIDQTAKAIYSAYNPQASQALAPRVVSDALVDAKGSVLYQAPQKQDYQWSDRAGAWIPKPGAGGQQLAGPSGDVTKIDMDADVALANDMIASGIPETQVDAFLKARGQRASQAPAAAQSGGLAAVPVAGIEPKPDISPAEQQRLDLAREANARAAEANQRAKDAADRAARGTPPTGMRWNAEGTALEPIPGAPAPASNASEGERNAAGFYQRMVASNAELKQLTDAGYDPTNLRDYTTVGSTLGNYAASPQGQQYHQAAMNWVRANLRKESGAAIGKDEAEQEIRNYFPKPGDSEDVIKQKARSRETTERAMRQAAGRAIQSTAGQQAGSVPQQAIYLLRQNPQLRQQFEQKYRMSADQFLR